LTSDRSRFVLDSSMNSEMGSVAAKRPPSADALRRRLLTVVLAGVWLLFAQAHLVHWYRTGHANGLGMMVVETVIAVLFIVRREPLTTSRRWGAWAATAIGTFGSLAIRPTADPVAGLGQPALVLQLVGAAVALMSLFAIGRSFGLVAANRGIKTSGPYSFVRHPVYAGYLIVDCGYLLENPSAWNAAVLAVATMGQIARISCEEELLAHDPEYANYRRRVRYRLVPLIY
jgi:protein-S-isoprenylcysteine O-methyltransferase Ste14